MFYILSIITEFRILHALSKIMLKKSLNKCHNNNPIIQEGEKHETKFPFHYKKLYEWSLT